MNYEEIRENQKKRNEKKIFEMIEKKIFLEMKRKDNEIEKIYIFNNFENKKYLIIEMKDFELNQIEIDISPDYIDFKIDNDILSRFFIQLYNDNELKEIIKDFLFKMIELNEEIYNDNYI